MPYQADRAPARTPLRAVTVAAVVFSLVILGLLAGLGRAYGREPRSDWTCDDTRFTQLVPRGRGVVGAPVSPPPGCVW